jgi:hypothetical protein
MQTLTSSLIFALSTLAWLGLGETATAQKVIINEIMYHPAGTNVLREWIELHNPGPDAALLTGWRISNGIGFVFPNQTEIPPGGYLVVAADAAAFTSANPGITNFVAGWSGGLSGNGEEIRIEDANGNTVDSVAYAAEGDWAVRRLSVPDIYGKQGWEWFAEHDGMGKSLELVNPVLPHDNGLNWSSSLEAGGTPGRANSAAQTNSAPVFSATSHFPLIPRSTESVRITTRIFDEEPSGVTATLWHRVDGATSFSSTPMLDDGLHSDGVAGDGIFGAVLPPQPNGTIVEFYLTTVDRGARARKYPAVIPSGGDRTANLLYQVSDTPPEGSAPFYRIIISSSEYDYLKGIWSGAPNSDAEVSGAFTASDSVLDQGTGTQVRYLAGFRNRGHGTRTSTPHNFRVDLPKDRPWQNRAGINLNTQFTQNQMLGSALMRRAGLPMAESRIAQVTVNGENLARNGSPQFGAYVANELVDGALVKRQIPDDADGNLYRGIRDAFPGNPKADLAWHGSSFESYTNAYFKQNNANANDWHGLIAMIDALNNSSDQNYVSAVVKVANVREWMRYFAMNTLMDNQETALGTGYGDDYALYEGINDPRFIVLPYDMDSILGSGTRTTTRGDGLFRMTSIPALDRLMNQPEFAPLYYEQLEQLAATIFDPAQINPVLDQLAQSFPPGAELDSAIENMKSFNAAQVAYVLSLIPLNLTVSSSLPVQSGYPRSTAATASLQGQANSIKTRSVGVNGVPAVWNARNATWTAPGVALHPGLNPVLVQSFDAAGVEFARTNYDIWFDDGSTANAPASIVVNTTWSAAAGPYSITPGLNIANGATLTIEPGTTVYLAAGANLIVASGGRLIAEGSAAAPIRFTRAPGSNGNWGGIVVNGGAGSPETRVTFARIEFNGGTAIHSSGGTLFLDHLTFGTADAQFISLDSSSFVISHCVFPTPNSGFEPAHGTGGIKAGGHGLFLRNFFGATQGYNDVIDFTGGNRPGPILQVIDNVFTGASDDVLDLDSTDAWVERNIFLHTHKNGSPDSASAVSGGDDNGEKSEVTILGNIFYDCDQAATAKQGNYFTLINNTIVHQTKQGGLDTDAGVLNFADAGIAEAAGMYFEGNIIYDAEKLTRNLASARLVVTNNLMPFAWAGAGGGNSAADPIFEHIPNLEETHFNSWEEAQVIREWLSLQPASPALGAGPNGADQGGVIPLGASISGAPSGTNNLTSATLTVGVNRAGNGIPASGWPNGAGYTHYKWRLDGGAWSAETPISIPISLTGLSSGSHQVEVSGKRDSTWYQDDPLFEEDARVATSAAWVVDPNFVPPARPAVRINEILAKNVATQTVGETTPDLVELYNQSDQVVDLAGLGLSDDPAQPRQFVFPAGSSIPAHGYLVLYTGHDTNAPGPLITFALNQGGDSLFLFDSASRGGALIDSVAFGPQVADFSIGLVNGAWELCTPTFGAENQAVRTGSSVNLRINEWLASAQFLYANDFVELYNPESSPVALGGLFLSDAAGTPDRSPIPPLSFIGAHGYQSFIADGNLQDGADHIAFKLSSGEGLITLSASDLSRIDSINYGPQRTDVSQGRSPDGAETLEFFAQPTPDAPNPGQQDGNVTVTQLVTPLINFPQVWRYRADGVDLGSAWSATAFDDSSWQNGPALLGVETSNPFPYPLPIQTPLTLAAPGGARIKTYYFRTHFTVTNTAAFDLWSTNYLDDGAVYYINGARAGELRVSANPASYTSDAVNQPDEGQAERLILKSDSIVAGDNILAVEVHQSGNNSSDIVFGMSLAAVHSITNVTGLGAMPVVLNEILAVDESLRDAAGQTNPWIELYNPSTNLVDLADVSLTDDPSQPRKWVFPSGAVISNRGYLVVNANPGQPPSSTNSGLTLHSTGGVVYLFAPLAAGGGELDAVSYGLQTAGYSIARIPDGTGEWELGIPARGGTNTIAALGSPATLRLNEWMADPQTGEDWFELFNPDSAPVALAGMFFTDDLTQPAKSPIRPLSFIGSGSHGYVQFFADKQPARGANHTSFKLSKAGSALGLFAANGTALDQLNFGAQATGISEGRLPDGGSAISRFPGTATPGASNAPSVADSDGDGMPDDWETAHGLNPHLNDANLDGDGDGLTNLAEYLAGTDPANPSSNLVIAARAGANGPVLLIQAAQGHTYTIEYRDSLSSGAWQKFTNISAPAAGGSVEIDAGAIGAARFFRVVTPAVP